MIAVGLFGEQYTYLLKSGLLSEVFGNSLSQKITNSGRLLWVGSSR